MPHKMLPPMPELAAQLLASHKVELADRIVSRIQQRIHGYSRISTLELRASVEVFLDRILSPSVHAEPGELLDIVMERSESRVRQGFSLSEFLGALFSVFPAARSVIREVGLDSRPEFAASYEALEGRVHELMVKSAEVYSETISQQIRSKNEELNRLNQRLSAHEKLVKQESSSIGKALTSANEFNSRVLQSLSSGVFVADAKTRKLVLWSGRMESITGLSAERALGRDIVEVLNQLEGLDGERLVAEVRRTNKLPVTKMKLRRPDGRDAWVYVRGHRLLDAEGEPEGTVGVIDDVTERELLIDSFSRYVSRDAVRRVLSRSEPVSLGGERKTVTIFFVDIRGFTSLAETQSPESLHALLNDYFRLVIDSLAANQGFIDKFIGDNVMALFVRTSNPAEGARQAVRAAIDIQRSLLRRNEGEGAGEVSIQVGIGVNTGEVMLGNIGSKERMEFTAIGDSVNVTARLQTLARAGEILIGESTAALVEQDFVLEDRGLSQLKGRREQVRVFAVREAK